MKAFYKKINELNKGNISWIVIWILAIFSTFCMISNFEDKEFGYRYGFFAFAGIYLLIQATLYYIRKHMLLFDGGNVSRKPGELAKTIVKMESIMKLHSFSVGEYFGILAKNLIPAQVISVILVVIFGVVNKTSVIDICIITSFLIILPQLVLYIYRKLTERSLMNETGIVAKVVIGFIGGILGSANFIICAVMAFLIQLLIYAIISNALIMKGIDDNEVVRVVTTNTDAFLMISIICTIILIVSSLGMGNYFTLVIGHKKLIRIVAAIILVLSISLYFYTGYSNNIKIYEDKIVVREGRSDDMKTYEVEKDIKDFHIYEGGEAIKMDITMSDGKVLKLLGNSCDDTTAWAEKYYSDYNYIADLAERLMRNGIQGTFDDRESIKNIVAKYDKECQEGYEQITDLFPE